MWKWGRWTDNPGGVLLGIALAWVLAVFLLVFSGLSLWHSQRLQTQLDRDHAVRTAQLAVAAVLVNGGGVSELQGTAGQLLRDETLGFRFVAVRALGGIVLAQSGIYDSLALPLVTASVNTRLRQSVYQLVGEQLEVPVMEDGRRLATLDLILAEPVRREIHDEAVRRLKLAGWIGLMLGVPLVALLVMILRRGVASEPAWVQRLGAPARELNTRPTDRPAELDVDAEETFSQLGYGVIRVTRDARVRDMNEFAVDMTGWEAGDAAGRLVYSVFHPLGEDEEPLVTPVESALRENVPTGASESRLRARDGSVRTVEAMASLTRDDGGSVDGAMLLFRDISDRRRELDEVRRQSRLTLGIIDHLVEGVMTTDANGIIGFANLRAMRMFGYARDELNGATVTKLMPVPFLNTPGVKLGDYQSSAQRSKLPRVVGWRKDATTFPVELLVEPMMLPGQNSRSEGFVVIVRDITDRLKSDNLSLRLGRLLDSAAEEVYVFDAQSLYLLDVNKSARRNLGYRQEQLARMTPLQLAPDIDPEVFYGHLSRLRGREDEHVVYRTTHQRIDGSSYPVEVRLSYSRDEDPPVYMALVSDITERQAIEERLQHLAHNDALTGLPNRPVLYDRLQQAVLQTQRSRRLLGVMFIDLDRFKAINDNYGHEAGDQVLRAVAERLKASLRLSDTVARLAGDEFVVLVPGLNEISNAEAIAQKVVEAFRRPMNVAGQTLVVTASVGMAIYPIDESEPEVLLQHADQAMFDAKRNGRAGYRIYAADTSAATLRRIELERDLHHAYALDQLSLRYEPIYAAGSGEVGGLRLSAQWQHSRYGEIAESEIVALASHIGELDDLMLWQLQQHCQTFSAIRARRPLNLPVFFDLADWQLHDASLCKHILELLQRNGMATRDLVVGYSETEASDNAVMPQPGFALLRQAGVRFCVNEVGGGLTSLNALGGLPMEYLRLAQACVAGVPTNENATAITKTVLAAAQRYHKPVLAYGITHPAQRDLFAALGGAWVAGPVLAEPMTAAELEDFLVRSKAKALP